MTQYSLCFHIHTDQWPTLDCESVNKWKQVEIESLSKYPTINFTAFRWNNVTKFLNYQILAGRFVLNLRKWKNARCHFPVDILLLPGTRVNILYWIRPVHMRRLISNHLTSTKEQKVMWHILLNILSLETFNSTRTSEFWEAVNSNSYFTPLQI